MPKRLSQHCRVDDGSGFELARFDPSGADLPGSKSEGEERLAKLSARLSELQDMLYAQDRWAVLIVFQALDAAGKDGTIKHVLSGLNPQGCQTHAFKAPSAEELDHDFLWRCTTRLPERGRIGIFNRSWYEEVLVVRVHPELLETQRLPETLVTKRIWKERLEDIAAFERHLARNGTLVLKFFLHVSKDEQRRRFMERLDEPEKNWKFSPDDVAERAHWDAYQAAFESAIRATAAEHAPWFVIPADRKWLTRLAVSEIIVGELEQLGLAYPKVRAAERARLDEARARLESEG